MAFAGKVNDDRMRRGRGVFRIQGGELLMAPLIEHATRTSYLATCGSNLNQIAMARMAFENEHAESLQSGEW